MIRGFACKATEDFFHGHLSAKARALIPQDLVARAYRKLDILNAAVTVNDLKTPPGNRLEMLKGDYQGKYSIRINAQFRIVFSFMEGHAYSVEIIDYH